MSLRQQGGAFEVEGEQQGNNKVSGREVVRLMRSRAESDALAFLNTWNHASVWGQRACDELGDCYVCRLVAGSGVGFPADGFRIPFSLRDGNWGHPPRGRGRVVSWSFQESRILKTALWRRWKAEAGDMPFVEQFFFWWGNWDTERWYTSLGISQVQRTREPWIFLIPQPQFFPLPISSLA